MSIMLYLISIKQEDVLLFHYFCIINIEVHMKAAVVQTRVDDKIEDGLIKIIQCKNHYDDKY